MSELSAKAKEFVAANKLSPVVYGAVTHLPGEAERPENVTGCRYTLENGRTFTLKSGELRRIEPRWKLS